MATFQQMCNAGAEIAMTSALIGERVTIRGTAYDAVVDSSPESEMFAGGGAIEGTPISVVLKYADAPTDLRKGERITYSGNHYTVRQVDSDGISFVTLIGDSAGHRK